jgi:hypothetical protein
MCFVLFCLCLTLLSVGSATDVSYVNKITKMVAHTSSCDNNTLRRPVSSYFVKHKMRPLEFTVLHFAGPVAYTCDGWLVKSRDTLSATCRDMMSRARGGFIRDLFPLGEVDRTSASGSTSASTISSSSISSSTRVPPLLTQSHSQSLTKTRSTLGSQFRTQLMGLVAELKTTEVGGIHSHTYIHSHTCNTHTLYIRAHTLALTHSLTHTHTLSLSHKCSTTHSHSLNNARCISFDVSDLIITSRPWIWTIY